MPGLALGHIALAALLLVASLFPRAEGRTVAVRLAGAVGMAMGLLLAGSGDADTVWRSTILEVGPTTLSGVAITCAWLLVFTLDPAAGRTDVAACVGVAAAALALTGTSAWLVPMLLFLVAGSGAVAVAATGFRFQGEVLVQVAGSGALVVAAGVVWWVTEDLWELPMGVDGAAYWLLVAGATLRAGAIPRLGIWRMCGCPAAAAAPLLTGGAFLIVGGPGAGTQPWLAGAALLAALALGLLGWHRPGMQGAWMILFLSAATFAEPQVAHAAGIAACFGVTTLALGPPRSTGAVSGIVTGFVPPTLGGLVGIQLISHAFERATATTGTEAASWIVVLVLAGSAGVVGMAAGARNLTDSPSGQSAAAIAGLAILFALFPNDLGQLPGSPLGDAGQVAVLALIAILVGGWVAYLTQVRGNDSDATSPATVSSVMLEGPEPARPLVMAIGLVSMIGVTVVVLWLTYEGLKVGFL